MAFYNDALDSLTGGFQDYFVEPWKRLLGTEDAVDPFEGIAPDKFDNEVRTQMPDGSPLFDDFGNETRPQMPGGEPLFNGAADAAGIRERIRRENLPVSPIPPFVDPDEMVNGARGRMGARGLLFNPADQQGVGRKPGQVTGRPDQFDAAGARRRKDLAPTGYAAWATDPNGQAGADRRAKASAEEFERIKGLLR